MWVMHRRGVVNFFLTTFYQYHVHIFLFIGLTVLLQAVQVLWERRRHLPVRPLDPTLLVISLLGAAVTVVALSRFGVMQPASVPPVGISWLTTEQTFLGIPLPLLSIMALNIWTTAPTFMVIFLAGLQDVPQELYEVAEIDGATGWQKLWYITIPALRPVLFLVITLGLIGTLQLFDQIAITSGVAPLNSVITLAYYVYWNIFGGVPRPEVGMASAAALFLAALTLAVVLLQRRFGISEKGWHS
jgi:multiple sugar transport system permease protein